MATTTFQHANRVHESLLARPEKRLLVWLAERTPRFINSDHLSLLGLVSMIAAGAAYFLAGQNMLWLLAVNVLILLNWLGDSLDGTLARVRNRQRPRYGFYVDHVIDMVSAVFLLGGLALSGFMSPVIAVAVLIAFLLLAMESFLATYTIGKFHVSHAFFGPTELRILLIVGNLFLFRNIHSTIFGEQFLLFDVGGAIGAAGMIVTFLWMAVKHTRMLYDMERLP